MESGLLVYERDQGEYDWNYPWELSASIYRLADVRPEEEEEEEEGEGQGTERDNGKQSEEEREKRKDGGGKLCSRPRS